MKHFFGTCQQSTVLAAGIGTFVDVLVLVLFTKGFVVVTAVLVFSADVITQADH